MPVSRLAPQKSCLKNMYHIKNTSPVVESVDLECGSKLPLLGRSLNVKPKRQQAAALQGLAFNFSLRLDSSRA
jgi:hypothetical protein